MPKIKAVEFMRSARAALGRRYAGLPLKEKAKKIEEEVEKSPTWKEFLKRHRKPV